MQETEGVRRIDKQADKLEEESEYVCISTRYGWQSKVVVHMDEHINRMQCSHQTPDC